MALLVVPSLAARALLSVVLSGVAIGVARVAGLSLLSSGIGCWPGKEPNRVPLGRMTTFGLPVTLDLPDLGTGGKWVGPLLWPAVALSAGLTLLLMRALFRASTNQKQDPR